MYFKYLIHSQIIACYVNLTNFRTFDLVLVRKELPMFMHLDHVQKQKHDLYGPGKFEHHHQKKKERKVVHVIIIRKVLNGCLNIHTLETGDLHLLNHHHHHKYIFSAI